MWASIFLEKSGADFDQVMMHDADVLASDALTQSWYAVDVTPTTVVHLTDVGYKKYEGKRKVPGATRGVVVLKRKDFKASNGFPLDVWGWAHGLEDRVWADRLGAVGCKDFKCPIGKWEDMDEVDLLTSLPAREDPLWHFDSRYMEFHRQVIDAPYSQDGRLLPGPEAQERPATVAERRQRLQMLISRTGGLNDVEYKVLYEDTLHTHAKHIRVLLDQKHG